MVVIKMPINESMTEAMVEVNLGMQPALDPAYASMCEKIRYQSRK